MTLGAFEHHLLLAALHLDQDAYGVEIAREIERRIGREISRSALYVTFDRLEAKGYLSSRVANPTVERGGKPRRYVKVTRAGLEAVRQSRAELVEMWRGLEGLLDTGR